MHTHKCVGFVEELSRHIRPRKGKKGFCMLEAYMDESGIQDGAHICCVAGYWGGENQWRRFEERWKKIIEDADTPGLKEFKSTQFWGRT